MGSVLSSHSLYSLYIHFFFIKPLASIQYLTLDLFQFNVLLDSQKNHDNSKKWFSTLNMLKSFTFQILTMDFIPKRLNTKKDLSLVQKKEVSGWIYVYMHANALLTRCEVKMAGYWPSSFLAFKWSEMKVRSIKNGKWTRLISSHPAQTSLFSKGFTI